MRLYYEPTSKEVFYAVYYKDLFQFIHTTNIPLLEFEIDELNGNVAICYDLKRTEWKFNEAVQRKYYIDAGELYSRDGWQEMEMI